jgi:ABC-type glycerol-3-phosphate transport system substrate-binding protein
VLIREDRLEKAGIEKPTVDWTWDEFLDVAQKLKGVDGIENPVGIFGNGDDLFFLWNAWTVARNGGRNNGIGVYSLDMTTATVNSPAGQRALMDMCDLVGVYKVASPSVIEWDGTVIESKVLDGSLSMVLGSPDSGFTTTAVSTGITEKVIVLPPPRVNGNFGATLHLSVTSVMSYSKNPNEAIKFVAFLNNAENQAKFNSVAGWIPARMDAWELDKERINFRMEGTLYGMENGVCVMPGNPQAINIKTILQRTCNEMLSLIAQGRPYNEQIIKTALDAANIDVQAELDRALAGR